MYLLIVFLPLMAATAAGLFGHFLGENGAVRITSTLVATAAFSKSSGFL